MLRCLLLALAIVWSPPALAADARIGDLVVSSPWSRATAPGAPAGAVFVTITNTGDAPDRLIGADSAVARRGELHTHAMQDGIARMSPVEAITVPAGETVTLAPGGDHVMLMGLDTPLIEGKSLRLDLEFERAGTVTITAPILGPGSPVPQS